ncbi:hypothetical protein [Coraliomargarita parva]|uniref:hypothetical protein n=1 Tax=Coraliomargarita parva TaxID=3014050 RepID=UPI0022B2B496|nr:hypothetical protein [Coraliomargarita parva]
MELLLDSLRLEAPLDLSGDCLLQVTAHWPRPGIAARSAVLTLSLKKGRVRLTKAPLVQRLLLKEKVEGPFGLHLSLTRPQRFPELASLVRLLAGTGIESIGDLLAAGLSPTALRPLLREPFDALAERFEARSLEPLLEGSIDLDPVAGLPASLEIPLKLSRSFTQSQVPPGPKAREQRKSATRRYPKGRQVGSCKLNFQS